MVIFLLVLILVVVLIGREAFWKGVSTAVVGSALFVYYALYLAVIVIVIFLVELTIWASVSDLTSFTQWFWKYSPFTLGLPGLVTLIGFIIYKRRKNARLSSTDPADKKAPQTEIKNG
jgi:hypothetical protein